ncbi:MAG TPA: sigma-70 family RNA polymerase sigma factor [Pirellulales bacterium]|jgi:RNA polymerase sigma-70 factor (ECF subfamily)|nr:sigma-70 family RNA polymerase sigma factor [Pirellulales bacterium]
MPDGESAGNGFSEKSGSLEKGDSLAESRKQLTGLVAQHHRELYQYAYRLTGSTWDAEDLTQQTFLAAHRKLHQLRDSDAARAWLFAVLRRSFSKLCKRRTPTTESSLDLTIDTIPAEAEADPFEQTSIDRQQLQKALNELPTGFRVVVLMYYFEECSYREMATRLKLPIGTVMSRLARAKRHLRTRLMPATCVASSALPRTGADIE